MKKYVLFGLLIFMLAGISLNSVAQASSFEQTLVQEDSKENYNALRAQMYFQEGYSRIRLDTANKVSVYGFTRAKQSVDLISVTLYLQVNNNGSWQTLKSWNYSGSSTNYKEGIDTYLIQPGNQYRVHGIHEVWKDGVYESATTTTGWIAP